MNLESKKQNLDLLSKEDLETPIVQNKPNKSSVLIDSIGNNTDTPNKNLFQNKDSSLFS